MIGVLVIDGRGGLLHLVQWSDWNPPIPSLLYQLYQRMYQPPVCQLDNIIHS